MREFVEITVLGSQFLAPQPYAEGQPLSARDAHYLNVAFAAGLAKAFAKVIRTELGSSMDEIPLEYLSTAETQFRQFAAAFVLPIGRTRVADPLSRIARTIAEGLVTSRLRARGLTRADIEDATFYSHVDRVAAMPGVLAEARRRYDATKLVIDTILNLDDGDSL